MTFRPMLVHIFLGVLLMFAHGCAGPRHEVLPQVQGIPLNEICKKYNVTWQWDGVTQVVMLQYKSNMAKALVGSNVVVIGKERLQLSGPLQRVNSTIYVPDDFESKVLAPFGVTTSVSKQDWTGVRVKTVVVDAGHGGKDPGAQSRNGVREKDVVLDISRRVKNILEEAGIKVIMTRDKDVFITLAERTEIASKSNADLFVSIHANSNPSKKMQGMEVYYVQSQNKRDLEEEQRSKNEKMFAKSLNSTPSPTLTKVVADMMYTHKMAESSKLAMQMVSHGSKAVNTPNRGARRCRFFVVRNTLMPAVLVESGFLTNRQEEQRLNTPAYRQKMAEAIARSILNYASDN